jgi:hypothetical protein
MRRLLLPLIALVLGTGISIVLRVVVTSRAGLTLTSHKETHFFAWNLICFWIMGVMTVALGCYLYLRKGVA